MSFDTLSKLDAQDNNGLMLAIQQHEAVAQMLNEMTSFSPREKATLLTQQNKLGMNALIIASTYNVDAVKALLKVLSDCDFADQGLILGTLTKEGFNLLTATEYQQEVVIDILNAMNLVVAQHKEAAQTMMTILSENNAKGVTVLTHAVHNEQTDVIKLVMGLVRNADNASQIAYLNELDAEQNNVLTHALAHPKSLTTLLQELALFDTEVQIAVLKDMMGSVYGVELHNTLRTTPAQFNLLVKQILDLPKELLVELYNSGALSLPTNAITKDTYRKLYVEAQVELHLTMFAEMMKAYYGETVDVDTQNLYDELVVAWVHYNENPADAELEKFFESAIEEAQVLFNEVDDNNGIINTLVRWFKNFVSIFVTVDWNETTYGKMKELVQNFKLVKNVVIEPAEVVIPAGVNNGYGVVVGKEVEPVLAAAPAPAAGGNAPAGTPQYQPLDVKPSAPVVTQDVTEKAREPQDLDFDAAMAASLAEPDPVRKKEDTSLDAAIAASIAATDEAAAKAAAKVVTKTDASVAAPVNVVVVHVIEAASEQTPGMYPARPGLSSAYNAPAFFSGIPAKATPIVPSAPVAEPGEIFAPVPASFFAPKQVAIEPSAPPADDNDDDKDAFDVLADDNVPSCPPPAYSV